MKRPFRILALMLFAASAAQATSFHPPQPYVLETLYAQIKSACPSKDWPCFEKALFAYIPKYGPRGAIETLTLLKERGDVPLTVDAHHVAHHIGHHTAMIFGPSSQALGLCPSSYHSGCIHGFFQHVLGMKVVDENHASVLCEDLEKNPAATPEAKFSCYHGLGHGIMMYKDHELMPALKICDQIPSSTGQQGCMQGVFMENVDEAEEGRWQKGLFSPTDPLAPCDKLAKRYQYQCFINHHGWLIRFYHNDMGLETQACLKAPADSIAPCLTAIALSITNPSWQSMLLPGSDPTKVAENAWTLCRKFPQNYIGLCINAGLDNIIITNSTDKLDVADAQDFCLATNGPYRQACYQHLGQELRYATNNLAQAQEICKTFSGKGRASCLNGAGQ